MTKSFLTIAVWAAMWASAQACAAPLVGEALQRPALQTSHPERAVLLAAAWAGKRIVAVGERGIAIVSDDAGAQWHQKPVPTSVSLTAVQFVDAQHGWAVGHGGVVLSTVDGGDTWTLQLDGKQLAAVALKNAQASGNAAALKDAEQFVADGPDKPFLDLHFFDSQRGIVVGAYGMAVLTEDGGKTWATMADRLDNPGGLHLYSVGVQEDKVLMAGEQGMALLSVDAGASFRRLQVPYQGTFFRAAWLGEKSLLLAGLRGQLWRSDDLGERWSQIKAPVPVSYSATVRDAKGTLWLANQAGGLFSFKDDALRPVGNGALPPTSGLLALDADHLLALTVRGAVIVPVSGARK